MGNVINGATGRMGRLTAEKEQFLIESLNFIHEQAQKDKKVYQVLGQELGWMSQHSHQEQVFKFFQKTLVDHDDFNDRLSNDFRQLSVNILAFRQKDSADILNLLRSIAKNDSTVLTSLIEEISLAGLKFGNKLGIRRLLNKVAYSRKEKNCPIMASWMIDKSSSSSLAHIMSETQFFKNKQSSIADYRLQDMIPGYRYMTNKVRETGGSFSLPSYDDVWDRLESDTLSHVTTLLAENNNDVLKTNIQGLVRFAAMLRSSGNHLSEKIIGKIKNKLQKNDEIRSDFNNNLTAGGSEEMGIYRMN